MIINFTHRFIFVHIPKTAGTSITTELSRFSNYHDIEIGGTALGEAIQPYMRNRFGLYKHAPASVIRKAMGPAVYDGFRSIAMVRDPFSRLQSTYYFLKSWNGFSGDFADEFSKCDSFLDFLNSELWISFLGPDEIFRPQTFWLNDPKTGECLVNFYGKVENLNECELKISEYLFNQPGRLKFNVSNKTPSYEKLLDWPDSIIEKVQDTYRADFASLGYSVSRG